MPRCAPIARDSSGVQLRPKRMVDVSGRADCSVRTVRHEMGDADHAVSGRQPERVSSARRTGGGARGGREEDAADLSTNTTQPIEKVAEAAGPIWYQLYATSSWEVTQKLVRHAEQRRMSGAGADRGSAGRAGTRRRWSG